MQDITYRSKIDLWLSLVLGGSVIFVLGIGLALLIFGSSADAGSGWLVIVIGILMILPILALIYPLYYRLGDGKLLVRSGLLHWTIPLESIVEVSPTHNPAAAPALSLDRLNIKYQADQAGHTKNMVISPDNKTGFIQDMAKVVPGLQLEGEHLLRKVVG